MSTAPAAELQPLSSSSITTRANAAAPVEFEYVGRTALTVTGPLSGQRYRFAAPGARLLVDGRDAFALATVPVLERVRDGSAR
jgi:hypothetical protein